MKTLTFLTLTLVLAVVMALTPATAQEVTPAKITGPWLWMIVPNEPGRGGSESLAIDSLAIASEGAVTERAIADFGAVSGARVGNYAWTPGVIQPTGRDNINDCLFSIGMVGDEGLEDHSAYALLPIRNDANRQPDSTMHVGSDDAIKVWLNGVVVHNNPIDRGASDYQDTFPVTLERGENLLLVKVSNRGWDWSMFVGIDAWELSTVPQDWWLWLPPPDFVVEPPAVEPPAVEPPVEPPAVVLPDWVSIRDENLYNAIRDTLDLEANPDRVIPVEDLRQLTALNAPIGGIADLTGLEYATNLTWLSLGSGETEGGQPIADFSALAKLTNLEVLYLDDTAVSDVSALADLTNLVTLYLYGTDVSDVSALANLTNLERLNLGDTDVSDVSALAKLTNLESLYLYRTDVSDISAVANLTNLDELSLGGSDVSDVSAVANLTNLESLNLYRTDVSDISAVANLTNLESLNLGGTDVSDISALAKLPNLERLDLGGTDVSDVSALAKLTNLVTLYLYGTDVSDVSALANLTNLESLNLESCPLSYASVHTHIPALEAKGVEVALSSDAVPHRALLKVSGDNQEGAPNKKLPDPLVVVATDEDGQPIVGLSVVFQVVGGGRVTVRTDANGRAAITVTLSGPGLYKVKALDLWATIAEQGVTPIASWVLFTATVPGDDTDGGTDVNADVTGDGEITVDDLVVVARHYGKRVSAPVEQNVEQFNDPNFVFFADPRADVNGDGEVDVADILAVIAAIDAAAAPSLVRGDIEPGSLRAADVRQWLRDAKQANADPVGIAVLEQLLAALTRIEAPPKATALLANYPNPFNPETWIPYQLAEAAEVQVSIHSADGKLVRRLALGQMPAGVYQRRSRAAYWDGRNAAGEPVASGVYFYTLTAGEFSATRKMVIRK